MGNYGDCSHTVYTKQISNSEVLEQHKRVKTSKSSNNTEVDQNKSIPFNFVKQNNSVKVTNTIISNETAKQINATLAKESFGAEISRGSKMTEIAKQINTAEFVTQGS